MTVPLHFKPGEAAQVDFGKGPDLFDKRTGKIEKTWFFVMTLCWSRHQYLEIVTHQDCETWLNCHQNAFNWFGGVPRKIIIDNPKCAITKACYHDPNVQKSYYGFAESYGFIISACPPRDPKKKGQVESGVKYVKKSFFPLRSFRSLQEANQEAKQWVLETAGNRIHGSTFEKPLTRFTEIESKVLIKLPETEPEISIWKSVKLYKNCHVKYKQCFYSAPHELYNKLLWLKATSTTVTIYCDHNMVAVHAMLFQPGKYSTKKHHLPEKSQTFFMQTPEWCLERSLTIGENTKFVVENLLTDPVIDLLRAAQGIIKLGQEYGNSRLELACKRAIKFNAVNYSTIKEILSLGLDYQQIDECEAFDQLGKAYQGMGTYQRKTINH